MKEDVIKKMKRAYEMMADPKYADLFDPDNTDGDLETYYDSDGNELSSDDAETIRWARSKNLWDDVKNGEGTDNLEAKGEVPVDASEKVLTPEVNTDDANTVQTDKVESEKPKKDVMGSILNGDAFRAKVRDNR